MPVEQTIYCDQRRVVDRLKPPLTPCDAIGKFKTGNGPEKRSGKETIRMRGNVDKNVEEPAEKFARHLAPYDANKSQNKYKHDQAVA